MSSRRRRTLAFLGLVAALAACARGSVAPATPPGAPAPPPLPSRSPRNGLEVIAWMRRSHPNRELKRLAFSVRATEYVDESSQSRQRAYAALPGKMRVDVLPRTLRTGYVRDRQRLAVFRDGRRIAAAKSVDLRALLAYDVFAQGIDTTIAWLDTARVRFALLRRDKFAGRSVWVVGAEQDDSTSSQFWVDAEHWRVVRVIQRDPRLPRLVSDVRYTDYTELLDTPVPTRIEIWRGGKLVEEQELSEFVVNPALPRSLFDLTRWRNVTVGN